MDEPQHSSQPHERDLDRLFPIVLPLEALDVGWPGPIIQIGNLPFAATWAVLGDMNTRVYVNHDQAAHWETDGVDWKARAFENLIALSRNHPATHAKSDDDGKPFLLILLHEDTIGPSRLLVPHLFDKDLQADYMVAIPEATCAVAYRSHLSAERASEIDQLINGLFERGTEPMIPTPFEAARFWCLSPESP